MSTQLTANNGTITVDYTAELTAISNTLITISSTLATIQASITALQTRGTTDGQGIYTAPIAAGGGTGLSASQQRAVTVAALKESGVLDKVAQEINNPTVLPGD